MKRVGHWTRRPNSLNSELTAPKPSLLNRVKAMLSGQHVQARCMSFKPATAHLFINDRQNPYTTAPGTQFNWYRARQVGGRLHLWGRNAVRMSEQDLKAAEFDGFGDSWPISYEDLAPWYSRVERFLGVTGQAAGIVNLPDGEFSGPTYLTTAERTLLEQLARRWPDRPATCSRVIHHMADHQPPPLKAASATGRFELRSRAVVSRVETDPNSGLATGVTYVDDETRALVTVTGRVVVLCASTIESVRNPAEFGWSATPAGPGQFIRQSSAAIWPITWSSFAPEDCPRSKALTATSIPTTLVRTRPFTFPRSATGESMKASAFCAAIRSWDVSRGSRPGWYFMTIGEVLPRADNRIELDRSRRDAWGIPVPRITMRYSDNERAMVRDMNQTLDDLCQTFALPPNILGKESVLSRTRVQDRWSPAVRQGRSADTRLVRPRIRGGVHGLR